jgi:hypothetical protein
MRCRRASNVVSSAVAMSQPTLRQQRGTKGPRQEGAHALALAGRTPGLQGAPTAAAVAQIRHGYIAEFLLSSRLFAALQHEKSMI